MTAKAINPAIEKCLDDLQNSINNTFESFTDWKVYDVFAIWDFVTIELHFTGNAATFNKVKIQYSQGCVDGEGRLSVSAPSLNCFDPVKDTSDIEFLVSAGKLLKSTELFKHLNGVLKGYVKRMDEIKNNGK